MLPTEVGSAILVKFGTPLLVAVASFNRNTVPVRMNPADELVKGASSWRGRAWPLVFALVLFCHPAAGQRALNWRVYKAASGLAQSSCVSVSLSAEGHVLVRHPDPPMVSEFDGYAVHTNTLPEPGIGRVYSRGSRQLWLASADGLLESKGGGWIRHPLPEIAAYHGFEIPVVPISPRHVLFLLPDGLMGFNCENPRRPLTVRLWPAAQDALGKFTGMTLARDDGLWLAGQNGLAKLVPPLRASKLDSTPREFLPPSELQLENFVEPHEGDDGVVTSIAELKSTHAKVVARFDGQSWSVQEAANEKLRAAWTGPDNTQWAFTRRALFQFIDGQLVPVENEELSGVEYFDVSTEPGGVFWLASSEGLFRCSPLTWRTPIAAEKVRAVVQALDEDAEGRLWFVSAGELHSLHREELRSFSLPGGAARTSAPLDLYSLGKGTLVLDIKGDSGSEESDGDSLFLVAQDGETIRPLTTTGGLKVLGYTRDRKLCLQRLSRGSAETNYELATFDGSRFETLADAMPEASIGPVLQAWFTTQNGDVWVCGSRGTSWRHETKWRAFSQLDKTTPVGGLLFAELADGKVCCATHEQVWVFDGKSWSLLKRGFERITSMLRSRDGSLWVGANNGLFRWVQGAWIENGTAEGLPGAAVRALYEDSRGVLWVGTSHGLSEYHPEADTDAPRTRIRQPEGSDISIPDGGTITFTFSGQDKWRYTPRDRLLYSYQMDQHDWSSFEEVNGVSFGDLPAGKHSFRVRAMDRNGNIEPEPARIPFAVILPWYRETRLLLIALAGLVAALFFAILSFNRHRKLVLSYGEVEEKVRQRTDELALANRELLHSQKMNALGTLAAGIAHDFNNILSIIKGSAQLIEENVNDPAKIRSRVDRINTVVEQGTGTVKALLGFTRDSDQRPGPCDLNTAVQDTIRLLGDRFLREVQVQFEPATNLPEVQALKDFVQQILLNFIFNAAESMEGQKQIVVSTRPADRLPAGLVLKPEGAHPFVLVSVRDQGCGISPENLARIFEPFFTTKALSARRGTGLGLSMVYELAKKMGAGLAVETELGRGSAFSLILPVAPRPEPVITERKPTESEL